MFKAVVSLCETGAREGRGREERIGGEREREPVCVSVCVGRLC